VKQLIQPTNPLYAVFGRGHDGDLYFIHMDSNVRGDKPGLWRIGTGDFKGNAVHENHDFYVDADRWHKMSELLTPEWCRSQHIRPDSIVTREVQVRFIVSSPKPRPVKGWKLKILECSRSYKARTITVVVNTSDYEKAFRIMLGATAFNAKGATALCEASCSWSHSAVNHPAQTCKLVFSLSDGEDMKLHVKRLLELYRG
jgi:hypothetical protein